MMSGYQSYFGKNLVDPYLEHLGLKNAIANQNNANYGPWNAVADMLGAYASTLPWGNSGNQAGNTGGGGSGYQLPSMQNSMFGGGNTGNNTANVTSLLAGYAQPQGGGGGYQLPSMQTQQAPKFF